MNLRGRMTRFQLSALVVATLIAGIGVPAAAQSTIIDDGSLGLNGGGLAVSSGTVTIPENLGARMGNNLFHSFTQFDIGAGETARFQGATAIQNVIARVSGTGASQIDGTIDTQSAMPSANFFLMNPNGISFGSGAALNVGGSVLFTTADEIGFTDGKKFPATIPVTSDLSSVAANRFGFLSQSPGDITFGGSKLHIRETHFPDVPGPAPGVTLDPVQQAKARQSLTAIGGDVTLPAGTEISSTALNLIAVGDRSATGPAGPRNINLDPTDYLSKPVGEALGSVAITLGEHYLDGEVIRVKGGNVSIVDSDIYAYGADGTGFGLSIDTPGTISAVDSIISVYAGPGGLELNARDISLIRGSRDTPYVEASTLAYFQGGSPRAGDVVLKATDSIDIEGYSVFSNTTDDHASGDVIVEAGGALRVSESKSGIFDVGEISTVGVNTQVPTSGPDKQIGDVTVTARTIEVSGAANISSSSFYANDTSGTIPVPNNLNTLPLAKAGNVSVTARACYDAGIDTRDQKWFANAVTVGQHIVDRFDAPLQKAEGHHFIGIGLPRDEAAKQREHWQTAMQLIDQAEPTNDALRLKARIANSLAEQLSYAGEAERAAAKKLFETSIELNSRPEIRDVAGLAMSHGGLGRLAFFAKEPDYATARAHFAENLRLSEQIGSLIGQTKMHSMLGACNLAEGVHDEAKRHYAAAAKLASEYVDKVFALIGLVQVNAGLQQIEGTEESGDALVALIQARLGELSAEDRKKNPVSAIPGISLPNLSKALEESRTQQSSRWHRYLSSLVDNNTELT